MKKLSQLRAEYATVCNEYAARFAKKHDLGDYYWIGSEMGGIADFDSSHTFSLSDMIEDLHNPKAKKGKILEWYDYYIDLHFKDADVRPVNYRNFLNGLR
jgi:hypothetical protein